MATGRPNSAENSPSGPILWSANVPGTVNAVVTYQLDNRPHALTASDDDTVRIWDLTTNQQTATLTGHTGPVRTIAVTQLDNRPHALTSSHDRTVRIWDLTTNQQTATLTGHTGPVQAIAVTELDNRPHAITASDDRTVRIWDLTTNQQTATLASHTGPAYTVVAADIDGRPHAITASDDRIARIWDLTTNQQTASLTDWVHALAVFDRDDRPHALTARSGGTVRVWDLTTNQETGTLTGHTGPVRTIAVTQLDNRPHAVTGGSDGAIRVWDLTTNQQTATLEDHTSPVNAIATTHIDGRPHAVTGGSDGAIRVWDLTTNQQTATLQGHTRRVLTVAVTQLDGRPHAISAGDGHTVRIWDLTTNQQTAILAGHTGVVCALAIAELDGHPHAIAGRSNGTVRVWDLAANRQTATLTGHTRPVRALTVIELDRRPHAIAGDDDGTIWIWDLVDLEVLTEFQVSKRATSSIATFETDEGPRFLTGGDDGVLQVWDLHTLLTVSTTDIHDVFNGENTGTEDRLERDGLAAHLIKRLELLTDPDTKRSPSGAAGNLTGSGIVHVDGRWGAGKTTFIELVLKSWDHNKRPLVVRYDAWRQSAIAPEWWSLASEIRRAIHRERALPTRAIMNVGGFLRRLLRSTSTWVALITVAALIGLGVWLASDLPKQVDTAVKVLTLITGTLTIAFVVTRSLFWSAPVLGRLHVRTDENPLAEISSIVGHLRRWSPRSSARQRLADRLIALWLVVAIPSAIWVIRQLAPEFATVGGAVFPPLYVGSILSTLGGIAGVILLTLSHKRPRRMVLLIIDDLDRCDDTRVVRLLEAVHTILRERAEPRGLFKNYRKPAPLGVLVLANGAWIRAAFTKHYSTFDRAGDNDVHNLGADFVQKIFDHSILVPALSPQQTEKLVLHVSNSHYRQLLAGRAAQSPESSMDVNESDEFNNTQPPLDLNDTVVSPQELSEPVASTRESTAVSTPPEATSENAATGSAPSPTTSTAIQASAARPIMGDGSPNSVATAGSAAAIADLTTNTTQMINHLLTGYHAILPPNPRLIIRVATSWAMLRAVGRSLGLEVDGGPATDLLVRAAVVWVRFPVLVDLLLDADEPPTIDPTNKACDARWRRRDVQRVLRSDDGQLINIEDLARYYGKFFDPAAPGPQDPTPAAATDSATTP